MGCQFGQAVRQPNGQSDRRTIGRIGHFTRNFLSDLEDFISPVIRGLSSIGQTQAAPFRLEQLMPQGFFQLPHLYADSLYGHVQALGRSGHAPLLGHDPKIIQMTVIQIAHVNCPSQVAEGASSNQRYNTGTTTSVSKVEVISPPITTTAKGR